MRRKNGNEKGTANTWHVSTAYNRNRHINSAAGPTRDGRSLYREDKGVFCNGEDWSLAGHRYDYKGFPIHAIADGLVIYNGQSYGKAIVLAHQLADGPVLSIYSHIAEKSRCAVGTLVHKGNVIGKIGHIGTERAIFTTKLGNNPL